MNIEMLCITYDSLIKSQEKYYNVTVVRSQPMNNCANRMHNFLANIIRTHCIEIVVRFQYTSIREMI